ncbi:hypothetical protein KCP91_12075 [Microvirga sp. SRT01]|uniref:Uncharacterized protein n=1 Tax=Sphingomonas longa TaxID=2778730 RepID=A0ABS2D854_9SPHN|nr:MULTISPECIES: hypothetical protein [Alphaproteobacteria]MBM6577110.1 hypothetical protein [Sphingomonas sp. BT552]MBR7710154.1 hypothetical protein [Microvirga sp. SRT01]
MNAVASELRVFMPSANLYDSGKERFPADIIGMWIANWLPLGDSPFLAIPAGEGAAYRAMEYADAGAFVIAGATSDMINKYREPKYKTTNGHVAVVTPGIGKNGFPRGYWGQHRGSGKADETLSLSFARPLKNELLYFAVMRGKSQ